MDAESQAGQYEVLFLPSARRAHVGQHSTLLEAALLAGLLLDAPCGGEGVCGKCRVWVSGQVSPRTDVENRVLEAGQTEEGWRLACQTKVMGPCRVLIPREAEWGGAKASLIGEQRVSPDKIPSEEWSYHTGEGPLGVALDIGTTTLSASVLDLDTAERLGASARENPQVSFGADVMTRITSCAENKSSIQRMREQVATASNALIQGTCEACGVSAASVHRLVVVGNPTMVHLFMGEDPTPMGRAPFEPPINETKEISAALAGIDAAPGCRVFIPGPLSGFLGADLVGVMLATGISEAPDFVLAVDLGTNGEMVLGHGGSMVACSTAAGPAFEGRQISCGMRASPGAIESISRDGSLIPQVIGGGSPTGICGSGLLDTIATLRTTGLLDSSGRLASPESLEPTLQSRIRENDDGRSFVLDPTNGLTLTQKDIREFQLAKGAVGAGVRLMMSRADIGVDSIGRVYLAGAFGNFLRPRSAVEVKIFPSELEERIEFAGNAAILGAEMMLLSAKYREMAEGFGDRVEVLDLAADGDFQNQFIGNLRIGV